MVTIAYTTVKEIVQKTGAGVEINNELLGTGDNSEQSYDIKNRHVISDTYTLSKAPKTGNDTNDFTDLTETTHYTLDKDSGRVLFQITLRLNIFDFLSLFHNRKVFLSLCNLHPGYKQLH